MTTLNDAYRDGALWALNLMQQNIPANCSFDGAFGAGWRLATRQAKEAILHIGEGMKIPRPYDEPPP